MGKSKLVKILGAVLVIIFLAFIYFAFVAGDKNVSESGLKREDVGVSPNDPKNEDNIELLMTLKRLEAVDFGDSDIFNNPAFISLQDFSEDIPERDLGRNNPFAPLQPGEIFIVRDNSAPIEAPEENSETGEGSDE